MSSWWALGFLMLGAAFAGMEIALVSVDRRVLRHRVQEGSRVWTMVLRLIQRPERYLTTAILCTYICQVAATSVVEVTHGELVAIGVLGPLILLFGEVLPKAYAQRQPSRWMVQMALPLWMLSLPLWPFTFLVEVLHRLVAQRRAFTDPLLSREALRLLLEMRGRRSDLEAEEVSMVRRLFGFSHTTAREVMVPLVDVCAVPEEAKVSEALRMIVERGFSRLLVYRGRVDHLVGLVQASDLLGAPKDSSLRVFLHPVLYVPESKPVDELLAEMQRHRQPMAVVVDEYGGAAGIVTLEDLLEEVVGEIEDEFDRKKSLFCRLGPSRWLVDARMEIDQIRELFGWPIPEGDYETLGGFLLERLGHIPRVGEVLRYGSLTFVVRRADERRVEEVEVRASDEDGGSPAAA